MALLNKHKLTFKDIFKNIIGLLFVILMINILIVIIFKDRFNELSETMNTENTIIENKAKEILENIYEAPVTLKVTKKDRNTVLFEHPKKTYGNNIYLINYMSLQDTFLINWELLEGTPEIIIRKIENHKTKEIIYEHAN